MIDGTQTEATRRSSCTIVIHRPELTPEEQARRMKEIKRAATRLILATEKIKRKEKQDHGKQHYY